MLRAFPAASPHSALQSQAGNPPCRGRCWCAQSTQARSTAGFSTPQAATAHSTPFPTLYHSMAPVS